MKYKIFSMLTSNSTSNPSGPSAPQFARLPSCHCELEPCVGNAGNLGSYSVLRAHIDVDVGETVGHSRCCFKRGLELDVFSEGPRRHRGPISVANTS